MMLWNGSSTGRRTNAEAPSTSRVEDLGNDTSLTSQSGFQISPAGVTVFLSLAALEG